MRHTLLSKVTAASLSTLLLLGGGMIYGQGGAVGTGSIGGPAGLHEIGDRQNADDGSGGDGGSVDALPLSWAGRGLTVVLGGPADAQGDIPFWIFGTLSGPPSIPVNISGKIRPGQAFEIQLKPGDPDMYPTPDDGWPYLRFFAGWDPDEAGQGEKTVGRLRDGSGRHKGIVKW